LKSKPFFKFFDRDCFEQDHVNFEERINYKNVPGVTVPDFCQFNLEVDFLNLNPKVKKTEKIVKEHI